MTVGRMIGVFLVAAVLFGVNSAGAAQKHKRITAAPPTNWHARTGKKPGAECVESNECRSGICISLGMPAVGPFVCE